MQACVHARSIRPACGLAAPRKAVMVQPPLRSIRMASCGSTDPIGIVTSSGCGKGSCGSGGGCSSNPSLEAILGDGGAGVGTMNTMMSASTAGISREDMAAAFQASNGNMSTPQGERVISIAELLASCPPDLVWEDDESN